MLSLPEMESVIASIQYKPGWKLHVYETRAQGIWFKVEATVQNSYKPQEVTDLNIKSPVPHLIEDTDEFLEWIRWRLEVIEIHECHEWLRWKGTNTRPIFDPHGERADEPAWPQ